MPCRFRTLSVRHCLTALLPLLAATVHADDQTVLVTGTRFAEADPVVAADVSVITREQIQNTPATNVPDLLKATAGIEVRPLYGAMGIDATVDLRGFADTATSNTLILLDGERLNPVDSGNISWSIVPIESIQRIEIIRGAGSVLYGDRASAGVINIITDRSAGPTAYAQAMGGSYGYREGDGGVSARAGGASMRADVHYADSDGWRRNSQADQQAADGRIGYDVSGGQIFTNFALYKDSNGLPGALFTSRYRGDPSGTRTPYDTESRDGYRVRPGLSVKLSDSVTLEGELGLDHEDSGGAFVSSDSLYAREVTAASASPRLRWDQDIAGRRNEMIFGADWYDGKAASTSTFLSGFPPTLDYARQISSAGYLQDAMRLVGGWSLSLGAREQHMSQSARQTAVLAGSGSFNRSALDAGLVYERGAWRAFGKYGSVFRFANTDELFGLDPITFNSIFAGNLLPQHGRIGEIGGGFSAARAHAQITIYRLDLVDEIAFDGNTFTNVNLPPTRRQGLEAQADYALAPRLKAHAAYTYDDARFAAGAYAGNEVPLVARNKESLQLTSNNGRFGTYTVATTTVGARRYSGDFANAHGTLAGYTTLDLQARWNFAPWTVTAKALNALNRRYSPYAGYSSFYNDAYFYPADARSLFLAVRYDYR